MFVNGMMFNYFSGKYASLRRNINILLKDFFYVLLGLMINFLLDTGAGEVKTCNFDW